MESTPNQTPQQPQPPAAAPTPRTDPPRRVLVGQFLGFMGPMLAIGSLLAILRLHDVPESRLLDPHSLFFASLAPIGLVVWLVSLWLRRV